MPCKRSWYTCVLPPQRLLKIKLVLATTLQWHLSLILWIQVALVTKERISTCQKRQG